MRIGELSAKTGVPVATIKYYVREGLMAGGERTGHNQVSYGEEHVRRLRLVRAMVETGALPIAKVREVLAEIEDPRRDLDSTLGVVSRALTSHREPTEDPAAADLATALAIVRGRGGTWSVPRTGSCGPSPTSSAGCVCSDSATWSRRRWNRTTATRARPRRWPRPTSGC